MIGTNYFIEGRTSTNANDTNWVRISPIITATNTTMTYCIDEPTPYRDFRVGVATEPPVPPPTDFIDPVVSVTPTNICFTWVSQVGSNYVVQAKINLSDSAWTNISPVITAVGPSTTFCIDRPTPYQFFRVAVLGGGEPPPPPPTEFLNPQLTITPTNICFTWLSQVGTNYIVQAKTSLSDLTWTNISPIITATSTSTTYCVDRPVPYQFFRVAVLGGTTPPPPPPTGFIDPQLAITPTNICITWPSQVGTNYVVQAKAGLLDPAWTNISPVITATSTSTTYCIDRPTPYQFFRIAVLGGTTPPPPPTQFIDPQLEVTLTNICFTWVSQIGTNYVVQAKALLADISWTNISPVITATSTSTTYCVDRPTPYQFFRIAQLGGGEPPPPPPPAQFIDPELAVTQTNICLTWVSLIGTNYAVQGKADVLATTWTNISPTITATSTITTYCVDRPTPYQFFRIAVLGGTTPPPPPATNISIIPAQTFNTNEICFTWVSLVGTNYVVRGKTNITDAQWSPIATVTANSTNTTYCIPLPTGYVFFQILQPSGGGGQPTSQAATAPNPPDGATNVAVNTSLSWTAGVGAVSHRVYLGTNEAPGAAAFRTNQTSTSFSPGNLLDATTYYWRIDEVGTQATVTGAVWRFTTATSSVASTNFIDPTPALVGTNLCFTWPSTEGVTYEFQGRTNLSTGIWLAISSQIVATNATTTFCIEFPTPYQFFRVASFGSGTIVTNTPPPTNAPVTFTNLGLVAGGFRLDWTAPVSQQFQVQYATNIPPVWIAITNLVTSTNGIFTFVDNQPGATNGQFRIYRVIPVP
jgi:hypothetical protein